MITKQLDKYLGKQVKISALMVGDVEGLWSLADTNEFMLAHNYMLTVNDRIYYVKPSWVITIEEKKINELEDKNNV